MELLPHPIHHRPFNQFKQPALALAISGGFDLWSIKYLLNKSINLNDKKLSVPYYELCISAKRFDILDYLITKGLDINQKHPTSPPLLHCIYMYTRHTNSVASLLNKYITKGADSNIICPLTNEQLIDLVKRHNDTEVYQMLNIPNHKQIKQRKAAIRASECN